jgi:hypothetical protein
MSKKEFRVNFNVTREYQVHVSMEKPVGMSDEDFAKKLEDEAYRRYGDAEYIEYHPSYGPSKIWIQEKTHVVPFANISENQKITIITPLDEDGMLLRNAIIDKYEKLSESSWREITSEQSESVLRVVERQGIDRLKAVKPPTNLQPWVGLAFNHIYIGIEPDGYAHS